MTWRTLAYPRWSALWPVPRRRERPVAPWPAETPIRAWGRDGVDGAMAITEANASALIGALDRLGVARRQAVISCFRNGMSSLFWSRLFDRVLAVTPHALPNGRVQHDKVTVVSGDLAATKFADELLAGLDAVDLLVLDERQYFRVIAPYYLFRKKLSRPALVAFVGMRKDAMRRFTADLASGHLDGFRHEIVMLRGGEGAGVAYEEILP
jgi:hypothetical protein